MWSVFARLRPMVSFSPFVAIVLSPFVARCALGMSAWCGAFGPSMAHGALGLHAARIAFSLFGTRGAFNPRVAHATFGRFAVCGAFDPFAARGDFGPLVVHASFGPLATYMVLWAYSQSVVLSSCLWPMVHTAQPTYST